MRLVSIPWFWIALVASPSLADVSVFRGPAGGRGNVEVRDESGVAPPRYPASLQGIELLPIDFTGRSPLDELLDGVPRLRTDIPGASRVLLPNGGGSLYRYRRGDRPGLSATFGLFVVGWNGEARSLWEVAGVGTSGRREPFLDRVAVSSQGESILVATTPEAGGDLVEIDLASGKVQVRTQDLPPRRFLNGGLSLLRGFGIGLASEGALRFERVNGSQATAVPFPGDAPAWFDPGVAKSAGEKAVAFLAGRSPDQAFVFVCPATGSAIQASPAPARLSGAGFLPDHPTGPLLALSTDASWVAWCTENVYSRECWLGPVGAPPGAPAFHITRDELFEDTLDDTGVISFVSSSSLCVLVGETEDENHVLEEGDLFRVDGGPSPVVTNLSRTADRPEMLPHSYGTLRAGDGISLLPGGAGVLLRARDESDQQHLVRIDVPSGEIDLLQDCLDLMDFAEVAGDRVLVSLRRSLAQPRVLLQVPLDRTQPPTSVWLPDACEFGRQVVLRREGVLGAVLEIEGQEWLNRTSISNSGEFLTLQSLRYGPTISFAPDGSLVASILAGETWFLVGWRPGSEPAVIGAGMAEGFLLPRD